MTAPMSVVAPRCPVHRPMRPRDCPRCRLREGSKAAARKAAVRAGTWEPTVDAAPITEHCRKLQAAGMPSSAQAAVTGLAARHIENILGGKVARLQPTTAEALLSLAPPQGDEYSHLVDATGTRRRLRGLAVNGWSQAALGPRLGVTDRAVSFMLSRAKVTRATAEKVKALADELYGLTGPTPEWARSRLVKPGWVPLEAWGDDIDDPDAVPDIVDMDTYVDEVKVDRAINGGLADADLTKAERTAAVTELAGRGMSDREIAIRLRWTDRHGKPASDTVQCWRMLKRIPAGRNPDGRRIDLRYDEARIGAAVRGEVTAAELSPFEKVETVRRLTAEGLRDREIAERLSWSDDLTKGGNAVQTYRSKYRITAGRPRRRRDSEPARVDLTDVA